MKHDTLENWEKWPLAALFLANALNIFILYVPLEEMPPTVVNVLPWIRVACGVAAAASLEGTLIAVTMGRRYGRDSFWSWATMFVASAFTAAVAFYVHHQIGIAAAALFMAQAVVLFIYSQHLAQPRKTLQPEITVSASASIDSKQLNGDRQITSSGNGTHIDGFRCRSCGKMFDSLEQIRQHRLADCPGRVETIKL